MTASFGEEENARAVMAASNEEARQLLVAHCQEYVKRNGSESTYVSWIAMLHPENCKLDERLRKSGCEHQQIWSATISSRSATDTWKSIAGREHGASGYQFGDLTRGAMRRVLSAVASGRKPGGEPLSEAVEQAPAAAIPTPDDCFRGLLERLDTPPATAPQRVAVAANPFDVAPGNPFDAPVPTAATPFDSEPTVPIGVPANPFGEPSVDGIRVVPLGIPPRPDDSATALVRLTSMGFAHAAAAAALAAADGDVSGAAEALLDNEGPRAADAQLAAAAPPRPPVCEPAFFVRAAPPLPQPVAA
jgi:hypothetical protein